MFSRIWLVHLILILCAAFFGIKAYGIWSEEMRPPLQIRPGETRKVPPKKKAVKGIPEKKLPPEAAYNVVVGKNLFAPQRTEIKPEAPKPEAKAPQAPKENPLEEKKLEASLKSIIVYGVVLADDYQGALVTDVKKTPPPVKGKPTRRRPSAKARAVKRPPTQGKGAKGVKWVQIGDELGDFEVADIMKDRIILKRGAKSYDLLVYDKDKPKTRKAVVAKAKPTVISTSSSQPAAVSKTRPKSIQRSRTVKKSTAYKARVAARRDAVEKLRRMRSQKK